MQISRSSNTRTDITSNKLTPQNMPCLRDYISYMKDAISVEKTINDPDKFIKKYICAETMEQEKLKIVSDAIIELQQVCDGIILLQYENPPSASDMTTLNRRSYSFLKQSDHRCTISPRDLFKVLV